MTKFFSAAIGAVAAAGMAISGAMAQEVGVANPKSVLPNFDIQAIGPVLNELGVFLAISRRAKRRRFSSLPTSPVRCVLSWPRPLAAARTIQIASASIWSRFMMATPIRKQCRLFNYRYAFASAGIDPSGSAYISRYENRRLRRTKG